MRKRMEVAALRPRYLEIEGLQSFKELQAIDFDKLGETGLFGIFGPTGSGKSTVLDALTLALYGNVQRAARGTQGIINTGANGVRVAFTFDLLKGSSRRTYRVERVYRRKKDSENSAEAKGARLFEIFAGEERVIADKPGEVTAKIEELLGLQLDDFTRSVVLPQNKFQEFLFLEKAKKREMLERIFYLEEYGRQLSDKVSKKLSSVRLKLSAIEGAMSSLGDASEKALIEAESNMQSARQQKERLDNELKLLEERFNEAKKVWDLVSELSFISSKETELLSRREEIDEKKKLYENSLKAEGLKDFIGKYRETEKNLTQTLSMLEAVEARALQTEKELKEARAAYEMCRERSEKEKPGLIEKKAKLSNALEIKAEIDRMEEKLGELRKRYIALKEQIAAKDSEINAVKSELQDIEDKTAQIRLYIDETKVDIDYRNQIYAGEKLENDFESAKKEKEKAQLKRDELFTRISRLEEELQEIVARRLSTEESLEQLKQRQIEHESSKPGDRNEMLLAINNYHSIRMAYGALKSKKADMDEIKAKIESTRMHIEQQSAACREAERVKEQLAAKLEGYRREAEELRQLYDRSAAYRLAATLSEGEPCPVCGSLHHPRPATGLEGVDIEEVESKLDEAQKLLVDAEKAYREAENECIKLNEQLKELNSRLTMALFDLESREKEYGKTAELLPEHMRRMELDALEAELDNMAAMNERRLKEAEAWEAKLNEIKESILKQSDTLSRQVAEEKGKRAEIEVNRDNLEMVKKSLDEAERGLDAKEKAYKEFIGRFKIGDVRSEIKRIDENDRRAENLQKQMEQLQDRAKEVRGRLDRLADEKQGLMSDFADVDAEGRSLKAQKIEKEQKIRELSDNKDIEGEILTIEERMNRLTQQEKESFENVRRLEAAFNELNLRKTALENQKEMYSRSLDAEKERLEAHLREKGFESLDEVEKSVLTEEEKKLLDEDIKEYERNQRNLQAHREMVERKLNNRSITEGEWRQISEDYALLKQKREDLLSLYEAAKNVYSNAKKNFERWVELNGEFQKWSRKSEMLEHIQKLLKGNSFVEFIAEERLRYIAKEATETLGVLTKYRYALELDTENGFVVRDNANGGVCRLVSSLSGGETFLTSLSLALALSKQIQLKGQSPLEFFFLDEGFGTLDGNLLDTVIDSLERLSSKERVIGLISHVPELKNRIARRLIVEPPSPDGRGSRVRMEKA